MNAFTANSWFDLLHWYSQNGIDISTDISEITENRINSGLKRNLVHFGTDDNAEKYILKQYGPNKISKRDYYILEKKILNSGLDFMPELCTSDDLHQVLVIKFLEDKNSEITRLMLNIMENMRRTTQSTEHWHIDLRSFLQSLGESLRKLHDLNQESLNVNLRDRFNWANVPGLSCDFYKEYLEALYILQNEPPENMRFCHGDLKMENMKWSGEKVLLIDYEMAHYSSPYFDFALVFKILIKEFFPSNVRSIPFFENSQSAERYKLLKLGMSLFFEGYNEGREYKIKPELLRSSLIIVFVEFINDKHFFENIDTILNMYGNDERS